MSNSYIKTPIAISFSSIVEKDFTLSSSQFMDLVIPNQNTVFVKDFLNRSLQRKDLGVEVGALNYIGQSSHFFLRTKALQAHSFLPDITKETALPIMPNVFVQMNLKKDDLIISKDSNIGEIVILDKDYPNYMLSGALYKLPVTKNKYYLLAFIKHNIFREQLDVMVPKGATIRHAKTMFLDCKIPMPNHNAKASIKLVEVLTQALINKELLIKERHKKILKTLEDELLSNQKTDAFKFELPSYTEIKSIGRLDSNLYREYFKKTVFQIQNYFHGYKTIYELGFSLSRGQNLQVSNIGDSVYCKRKYKNFYTLMLPKFLSKYGTVDKIEYLGNPNSLKTLEKGDLIFGAEGFEKGRSIVIIEAQDRVITNIHGITIQQEEHNVNKAIFVKCFLDYLRNKGLVDLYAVGGNGGSLAQKYWEMIPFPNFSDKKQEEIALLYHNPASSYNGNEFILENFLDQDNIFNKTAGIYELDKTAKKIRERLNQVIDDIVNDKPVEIDFNFLLLNI